MDAVEALKEEDKTRLLLQAGGSGSSAWEGQSSEFICESENGAGRICTAWRVCNGPGALEWTKLPIVQSTHANNEFAFAKSSPTKTTLPEKKKKNE